MKTKLTVHPELVGYLPSIEPDELTQLRRNLERDGCIDPIRHWRGHIIDGYNRYDLCEELHIHYTTKELKFDNIHQVKAWMIENQGGRRNWTQAQASLMSDRWRDELNKTDSDETPTKQGVRPASVPYGTPTIRDAAEKFNVSVADVHAAGVVRSKGADELIEAVETGKIPIRTAAKIAEKPKSEQRRAVARKNPAKPPKEKPAPAKPESVKDERDNPVPAELVEVFASRAEYDKVLQHFTEIVKITNRLLGDPKDNRSPGLGGLYFSDHRQEFQRLLQNARRFVTFARPYAPCPRKHNGHKCPACRGSGWTTKDIYDNAGVK